MAAAPPPDVLVLGAGDPLAGALPLAWQTGLAAGLADGAGPDLRRAEVFLGTGAGAVVAARLAAGLAPARPGEDLGPGPPAAEGGGGSRARAGALATAPLVPPLRALRAPGAARVRAGVLARIGRGDGDLEPLRRDVATLGLALDGRLRTVCVDRRAGRRVVLGSPGAPRADAADAVAASCAFPGLAAPVPAGGLSLVAGAVWSPTNLDAAPAGRDTHVLCLDPAASLGLAAGGPRQAPLGAGRAATTSEALAVRRRGARVQVLGPSREAGALLARPPAEGAEAAIHAAGYRQGCAVAERGRD